MYLFAVRRFGARRAEVLGIRQTLELLERAHMPTRRERHRLALTVRVAHQVLSAIEAQRAAILAAMSDVSLYGPQQSRFAPLLERRELRRPDPVAHELRRRLLSGLRGRVIEIGCGDGRAFELYPAAVEAVLAVEPDPSARAIDEQRAAD